MRIAFDSWKEKPHNSPFTILPLSCARLDGDDLSYMIATLLNWIGPADVGSCLLRSTRG